MKKILRIVLSSFALITLVSCGTSTSSSSEIKSSSVNPDSSETSTSSSSEVTSSSSSQGVSSSSSSAFSKPSSSSNSSSSTPSKPSSSSSSSSSSSQASSTSSSSSSSSIETKYHVTFVNYDDSVLYETDVLAGYEAVYVGVTPTKPEDDDYTYTFKGWDKVLTNVASNLTAKAEYSRKSKWSDVIWF